MPPTGRNYSSVEKWLNKLLNVFFIFAALFRLFSQSPFTSSSQSNLPSDKDSTDCSRSILQECIFHTSAKVPTLTSIKVKEPCWCILCHFTVQQFSSCWQCKQVSWKSDQAVILVLSHCLDLAKTFKSKFYSRAVPSRCFTLEVFKPGIKHQKVTTGFNFSLTCLPTGHPKSACTS